MSDECECQDCGKTDFFDFIMPNKIWNDVMIGYPIIYLKDAVTPSKEGAPGVLCYDCFCKRALARGYIPVFHCKLSHPNDVSRRAMEDKASKEYFERLGSSERYKEILKEVKRTIGRPLTAEELARVYGGLR